MKWLKKEFFFASAAFSLLLALLLTYSNHWANDFHFDDFHTIVQNPYVRNLSNTWSFFTQPQTFSILSGSGSYRPLCSLSFALDYFFGHGYNLFYFHLSTFIWYLAQLGFMFILCHDIFNKTFKHAWNKWLALFGVAWYGLHTANAETINYISARSDLISTALVVIALVAYLRSPFLRRSWLYLIPFILGALVKQNTYMFGPLLFVYVWLFEENSFLQALIKSAPAIIITLLFSWSVASMLSLFTKLYIPYFSYLISQPAVSLYYFKTFFLPIGLSADYGWGPPSSVFDLGFLVGLVFVAIMLIIVYFSARQKQYRPIAFGLLWFFLALLPTSAVPLTEIANDHRLFFPFVGLMMAAVWSAGLFLFKYENLIKAKLVWPIVVIFICLIILIGNALGANYRNKIWKNEETLWFDVATKNPKHSRGLMNYGLTQMNKGDYLTAMSYFKTALKYAPNYPYLQINLGIVYSAVGRQKEAEAYFRKALTLDPNLHSSYYFYARWLDQQGRQLEAIPLLLKSISLSPGNFEARYLLINIYSKLNDRASAMVQVGQILAIDPNNKLVSQFLATAKSPEDHLNLSLTYFNAKDYYRSIAEAKLALKLRPNYAEAYNNIGAAYNTLGQWEKGIIALEKALQLKPDFQLAKNNLAWAKSQRAKTKR